MWGPVGGDGYALIKSVDGERIRRGFDSRPSRHFYQKEKRIMKNVFERMQEEDSLRKAADFKAKMQQPYLFKRQYAEIRAWEFYNHPDICGNAYVAVGGLDSITLFVFLRSIGINIPAISVSILEDKSIQKVHKALGVIPLKPCLKSDGKRYNKYNVVQEFGFPILSKEIAGKIDLLQNPTEKNATVRHAIITGETGAYGGYQKNSRMKMSEKWLKKFGGADPEGAALGYEAAPFMVSDKCCYYLKEKPCNDYAKESGRFPYMGLMASEGGRREKALYLHGCNYISKGTKRSCPFAIYNRDDLLRLALEMNEWYQAHWQEFSDIHLDTIIPAIYGRVVMDENGFFQTTKAQRTGCSICGFGIHLEKRPHRFDRLYESNPKEWRYLMYDVGWGDVLDYIGVEWRQK